MVSIVFLLITLSAIISVVYKRINEKKLETLKKLIRDINNEYRDMLKRKPKTFKLWQSILIFLSQGFMVFAIMWGLFEFLHGEMNTGNNFVFKIVSWMIMLVIIYFVLGYLLLSITRIYEYLYKIEDKNTKADLLISYFIISMYMTILIIFPEEFGENYMIGLIGVSISYLLTLKVLISIIKSPHIIKLKGNIWEVSELAVITVIILVLIILSLSLGVCFVSNIEYGSYTNNPTYFDLFYYTVITFATVGYGDISPVTRSAKVMAIIISFTSILCITIFLSFVLSYKNEE